MTSEIIIPDASAIQVDTSCIDVSEVESQEEKLFLLKKGEKILRIVARAALEVGQQLVEIQEELRKNNGRQPGLSKYYESIGITVSQANAWANKFRAYSSYISIFGDEGANEKFNGLGDNTVSKIWTLPCDYREAFFADIALGDKPTTAVVQEVHQRTDVKLSKAKELLKAAKIRREKADEKWEMVKADPDIEATSAEYKTTQTLKDHHISAVNQYEKRIQELEQQIEHERLEKLEETKKKERIQADLDKLKSDDAAKRAERVAHLTNSLTASIPEVLADLQKFFAERDQYPEEVQKHLLEQSTYLTNYIADQLD